MKSNRVLPKGIANGKLLFPAWCPLPNIDDKPDRTTDCEKGIFKKPTVKQMKKIAKLIKENK